MATLTARAKGSVDDQGDFAGERLDCDGHLYMEPDVMAEIVGDAGSSWIIEYLRKYAGSEADLAARERARTETWSVKGFSALGSYDPEDRVDALDKMGVARQLLFPNTVLRELRTHTPAALEACRRYNDYVIDWTERARDRARAVCQLNMSNVDSALTELQRVVDKGARGVLLPCAEPPAGTSPASPVWDAFWRLLEESETPAFLHIGAGGLATADEDDPMLPARAWADAPALRAIFPDQPGAEERLGPFFIVVAHLAAEVYLTCMLMGGVFERFPRLRFGVIEFGASWLGPLCERLDRHAALLQKVGVQYPRLPSEYVRRNVRVTPQWTEPVDVLVERYGIREAYVFSTDYPHVEGGRNPVQRFSGMTARVGQGYSREFFVDNGRLLFP
jgi:predicted TIM-barrel fold metal-dependent hydrolase